MRIKTNLHVVSGKLEVAPLIDVIFLLLVFVTISSSLVFQSGIAVELPQTESHAVRGAEKIIITIERSGLLYFNDSTVQWDELERKLRELVYDTQNQRRRWQDVETLPQSQRTPLIVLRADKSIAYARIIEVISLAQSLELGVYLATEPARSRKASMTVLQEMRSAP